MQAGGLTDKRDPRGMKSRAASYLGLDYGKPSRPPYDSPDLVVSSVYLLILAGLLVTGSSTIVTIVGLVAAGAGSFLLYRGITRWDRTREGRTKEFERDRARVRTHGRWQVLYKVPVTRAIIFTSLLLNCAGLVDASRGVLLALLPVPIVLLGVELRLNRVWRGHESNRLSL